MKRIFLFFLTTLTLADLFPQTQDAITRSINDGDCETLYNYVSGAGEKDQKLLSSANQTIRKYTAIDSATVKYRTNKMDARVRNVGKELTANVFLDPARYLRDVVAKLTAGAGDQFTRAKILNDWICDNIAYDTETAFAGANRKQDYVSVIKAGKAVCSGYANLFNEMCALASIESTGISGYSKGFGYTGRIGPVPDHDWNAVKISGKWYLIDVTWNAGHVDHKTYIKNYSTDYLFLDSRPFLYSHLPVMNKYQFYAPAITKEQFMEEPYIPGVFFKYRLGLRNDLPRYNNHVDGSGLSVELSGAGAGVLLSNTLRTVQQQNIEGASWQGKSGNTFSFVFDVPDTLEYKGHIFARMSNDRRVQERLPVNMMEQAIIPSLDGLVQEKKITEKEKGYFIDSYFKVPENACYYFREDQFDTARNSAVQKIHPLVDLSLELYEPILTFNIRAKADYAGYRENYERRFPETFTSYTKSSNTRLMSPINGLLRAGAAETFAIESKDYTQMAVIINGQFSFFKKNRDGVFELDLELPEGIDELQIFGSKNNRNYEGLLRFSVN